MYFCERSVCYDSKCNIQLCVILYSCSIATFELILPLTMTKAPSIWPTSMAGFKLFPTSMTISTFGTWSKKIPLSTKYWLQHTSKLTHSRWFRCAKHSVVFQTVAVNLLIVQILLYTAQVLTNRSQYKFTINISSYSVIIVFTAWIPTSGVNLNLVWNLVVKNAGLKNFWMTIF